VDGGVEQVCQPGLLLLGEEFGTGVQGPPGAVERVVLAAAVAVDDLLDPASALVQRVAGGPDNVEGIMPTSA